MDIEKQIIVIEDDEDDDGIVEIYPKIVQEPEYSHKAGFVTFKPQTNKRQIATMMNTQFFRMLTQLKRWKKPRFKHANAEWIINLEHVKTLQILQFDSRICPTTKLTPLLSPIFHIKFTKLTILDLSRNKLKSIEQIQLINCPNLKSLNLERNFLTQVKVLQKIKFNDFTKLDLNCNKLRQLQYGRIKMSRTRMKHISVMNGFPRGQVIRETCRRDLSKFIKSQAKYLENIYVQAGIYETSQKPIKDQIIKKHDPNAFNGLALMFA